MCHKSFNRWGIHLAAKVISYIFFQILHPFKLGAPDVDIPKVCLTIFKLANLPVNWSQWHTLVFIHSPLKFHSFLKELFDDRTWSDKRPWIKYEPNYVWKKNQKANWTLYFIECDCDNINWKPIVYQNENQNMLWVRNLSLLWSRVLTFYS